MSDRHVTIGPWENGVLEAFDVAANLPPLLQHFQPLPAGSLVVGSLIQCGATKIDLGGASVTLRNIPERWDGKSFDVAAYRAIAERTRAAFATQLPEGYDRDPERYGGIWAVQALVHDLLYALEKRTAIISVSGYPPADVVHQVLPPVLAVPVANLFAAVSDVATTLPYPKLGIERDAVERFGNLLESGLLDDYRSQHERVHDDALPLRRGLRSLVRAGNKLRQSFNDSVSLRSVAFTTLSVVPKLIDTVFGKLPGAFADYGARLVELNANERRRVIIYRLDGLIERLFSDRLAAIRDLDDATKSALQREMAQHLDRPRRPREPVPSQSKL